MKRLVLFCFLLSLSLAAFLPAKAQDVQLVVGEDVKAVGEVGVPRENSFTYLYVEATLCHKYASSVYLQFFRQQKFWKAPVYLHAEFRACAVEGAKVPNIYMGGLAWTFAQTARGYVAVEGLYRYDGANDWQVTFAAGWEKGRWSYAGYADFFGTEQLCLFSENKFFYKVVGPFQVGADLEIGMHTVNDKDFTVRPFGILRLDF